MLRSGRFERRLLIALVLFSVIPTLLLVGVGTIVLREAVSLQTTPAGWERLGETGRVLLEQAAESDDPALLEAAQQHREELTTSIQNAQRWGYLNRRTLAALPWVASVFFAVSLLLALRSARRIARGFASPIDELVGWSQRVARGDPLPPPKAAHSDASGDFATLRDSFRSMERELQASRERAVEAARMRASVALARGVAHELKNALTPLRLAVRTLRAAAAPRGVSHEPLEVIDAESQRLEALARAFSQFGRPPEGPRAPIDVVELVQYIGRTHVPDGIDLVLTHPSDYVWVDGYIDPLSRAIANLVLNSIEAMGDSGGTLSLTVEDTRTDRVAIRVADTGPGLPVNSEGRLWDPDFTTKARGTGLGLALVRQVIHAHGGEIHARTRPTGGAEFAIILPRALVAPEPHATTASAPVC